MSAMIWTASPTDLSLVVMVVSKPISRMIIVENEFTTPLGIALCIRSVIESPMRRNYFRIGTD